MSDMAVEETWEVPQAIRDYLRGMFSEPMALRGQQLRGGGPVAEFESRLRELAGFPFCVAVANATSGLIAAAIACGLPGKKVIASRDTWAGSLGSLRFSGVEVIFGDNGSDGTLDLDSARNLLNSKGCSAIVATDQPDCRHDSEGVRRLCDEKGCLYLEDSAWFPGVSTNSLCRSVADIQVMSFGPGKPLSIGEGGAVLLRSREHYEKVIRFSQHPERSINEGISYQEDFLPLNARIHPLAALLGTELLQMPAGSACHLRSIKIPVPQKELDQIL